MLNEIIAGIAGSSVVAIVFGFWLKYYFGPYLKEKAKHLATREDIELVIEEVRAKERAKVSVIDEQSKRKKIEELCEGLVKIISSIAALRLQVRQMGGFFVKDGIGEVSEQLRVKILEFEVLRGAAGIYLSPKTNTVLGKLKFLIGDGAFHNKKVDPMLEQLMGELRESVGKEV